MEMAGTGRRQARHCIRLNFVLLIHLTCIFDGMRSCDAAPGSLTSRVDRDNAETVEGFINVLSIQ